MKNLTLHGHGHVVPRLDGSIARCGGPAICSTCAKEKVQWESEKNAAEAQMTNPTRENASTKPAEEAFFKAEDAEEHWDLESGFPFVGEFIRISSANAKVASLVEENFSLRNTITSLRYEKDQVEAENARLAKKHDDLAAECERLKQENTDLKDGSYTEDMLRLLDSNNKLRAENERLKAQQKIDWAKWNETEANEEIENLRAQLTQRDSRLQELEAVAESMNATIAQMREALEVASIDSMSIIEWVESNYPGLIRVSEWQALKAQHRMCITMSRTALKAEEGGKK